jgi:Tfp pilus assembly protein PilN
MKYRINLISKKGDELLSRIIIFLGYLRYILVLTQIVVIIVFFYKLSVDQKIIDLEEAIAQKQEIFTVAKPMIDDYLIYNYKINQIQELFSRQNRLESQTAYLLSLFPKDVYLTELKYSKDELGLSGQTLNPGIIRSFYSRLQEDKRFTNVVLESIKKTEEGFIFTMKLSNFK